MTHAYVVLIRSVIGIAAAGFVLNMTAGHAENVSPDQAKPQSAGIEGMVLDISGRDAVRLDEKQSGRVNFAQVTRHHAVAIRWVDTKGRVCEQVETTIQPPQTSVAYMFQMRHPIGYNHYVDVLVDGVAQPVSFSFHVVYPYQDWNDYYACVWAHYDAGFGDRLREIGLNGSIDGGRNVTDIDFAFYPDNIVYEVFSYYHKRRHESDMIRAAWAKYPNDRRLYHRRPSLTDDGTWDKVRDRLLPVVERARDYRPIFYNVADEIGISDQSAVSDLDWEYSSRTTWRNWLEKKYGTLNQLNAEWGTDYPDWGRVRAFFPSTNYMYDQLWRDNLLPAAFKTIADFNKAFGTDYKSFADVVAGYRTIRSNDAGMSLSGLTSRFQSVAKLNATLRAHFDTIQAAADYIAAFEKWVARQNATDTTGWNLAWWCDFRDYMEDYMADGLARAREIGKEKDPGGRFGITGTHHPGVFNGHNYAKLVNSVDAIIPYNIGQSFELIRGFNPDFYFMHPTWATGDKLKRDLWYHFLHGCRGVLIWDNHEVRNALVDRKTGTITARGRAAEPVLNEITQGTDRMLIQSKRENNGIAIYHSQASIRVDWMHHNIGLGRRWVQRQSWDEYRECERNVLRTSWIKLIEDNHLQFIVVSPQQVAADRLAKEGIRVLILPEVWAMSDAEADNIRRFIMAGGTVIADRNLGLYDSHGKRRENGGVLDDVFGIDQSKVKGDPRTAMPVDWTPAEVPLAADIGDNVKAGESINDLTTVACPAYPVSLKQDSGARAFAGNAESAYLIVRSPMRWTPDSPAFSRLIPAPGGPDRRAFPGVGETVFLNVDVSHYSRVRMTEPDKAEKLVELIRAVLPVDVNPLARLVNARTGTRQPGTEVGVWRAGPNRVHVAVWHNYQINKEGIGGEAYTDNSQFEKKELIRILFDAPYYICNQRTGEMIGKTDSVEIELDPWEPVILTAQEIPFTMPSVTVSGHKADGGVAGASVRRGEALTFHIAVENAAGGGMSHGALPPASGTLNVFHIDAIGPDGKTVWYYSQDVSDFDDRVDYTVPLALNEETGKWTFRVREVATKRVVNVPVTVTE